ncbi:MAG: citrate/2-methylcitrate synthase [Thermodesulfovibrionales bacterium]
MSASAEIKNTGLRGVPVADTKISYVDGTQGVLIYRGYTVEDLAARSTFMEVACLLLNGELPGANELRQFENRIREERALPAFIYECFGRLPKQALPMDVLQLAVPLLATADPELHDETKEGNLRKAVRLIARVPVVTAAWHRIRNGMEPVPADASLDHAANFLWQLTGVKPDPEISRDLDICLVLHADHTFNASTFACREVVSTRAHMYAGVAAGVGALSGSLHGGANERVMEMLVRLKDEKDIAGWVKAQLDAGQKIMGMGHAVYKTTDPRGRVLKEMSRGLGEKLKQSRWYELTAQVEEAALAEFAKRGKTALKPNVDFFSAAVYHMMGIPRDLMTPVFAISRIAGWCSHIIEEIFAEAQSKPALYRPDSDYIGNYCGRTGCNYLPIEARKRG